MTEPDYYKVTIKGVKFDVMDFARAYKLPITLMLALKYFRVKGGIDKQIDDLNKAIYCIQREIEYLNESRTTHTD